VNVILIGGGNTVYFLARRFTARGFGVVLINRDPDECRRLSRALKATVVCGDGSDPEILEEAGARSADVVLAATPNDPDNLVACQLAAAQYGVPRVVALAHDPDNAAAFEKLGVTAFATTDVIGSLIEQRAALEQITNLLPVGEGKVNVTEVALDASCPVAGRPLADLSLPEGALIGVIIRGGEPLIPRGTTRLETGDRVVLLTLPETHGRVLRALTGG
jgi:trk system potassium uptake protein TrkA